MTKQFSIGRNDDCQIKIYDNSQKVSRNHATLKILNNGKIFITDHSSNGTFVNGIKISSGSDYPVKRGDSISFAHVADLNWELIPRTTNKLLIYLLIPLVVIGLAIAAFFILNTKPNPKPNDIKSDNVIMHDSDSIKATQTHKKELIKDTINKTIKDSTQKKAIKKKEEKGKGKNKPSKEVKKEEPKKIII